MERVEEERNPDHQPEIIREPRERNQLCRELQQSPRVVTKKVKKTNGKAITGRGIRGRMGKRQPLEVIPLPLIPLPILLNFNSCQDRGFGQRLAYDQA
jgi:hypothetical protein